MKYSEMDTDYDFREGSLEFEDLPLNIQEETRAMAKAAGITLNCDKKQEDQTDGHS